jgi:hypothetical protein
MNSLPLDSDTLHRDIDATADRIDRTLQLLEQRAEDAARGAAFWIGAGVAAALVVTAVAMLYRRVRTRARHEPRPLPATGTSLRFGSVRMTGREA